VDGPHADTRLQIILLQAELETTTATADDDQLRLHAALADAYNDLGIYPQALDHGHQELALRQHLQYPGHPDTLTTRNNIAAWTTLNRHGSRDEPDQAPLAELGGLADHAVAAGDTAAAVSYCEQMVAAAEEAFGPGDIRLIGYLRRTTATLAAANRNAQAIETLTRAIAINDYYGAETIETANDLRTLAGLQQRNGLDQQAAQNLDRARDIETRHSKATR
jgi:tetratricopeptide (TPR) repeat protein